MDDFNRELTSDIEERSRSIFVIERVFFTNLYNIREEHKDVVLLHTIPMLYSLWEGFVQHSFQLYIDFLNRQCLHHSVLNKDILLSFTEKRFPQFKEYPERKDKRIMFIEKLLACFAESKVDIPSYVDTKSNVGFEELNNLLSAYSLEPFPARYKDFNHPKPTLDAILRDFLKDRNNIAHGGNTSSSSRITHEVFEKYKKLVLFLMYEIDCKFTESINNLSYMRQ
jgi:hypothetical protein